MAKFLSEIVLAYLYIFNFTPFSKSCQWFLKNFGLDAQKKFLQEDAVGQNDGAKEAVSERKHVTKEMREINSGRGMFKLLFNGINQQIVGRGLAPAEISKNKDNKQFLRIAAGASPRPTVLRTHP